jgi:lipopolysaccharide heptosyltransferase II
MNILVRLPNWLGDLVMSSAFVNACSEHYAGSRIDVIVKKIHSPLMALFNGIGEIYSFDPSISRSMVPWMRFSRSIADRKKYDLFFCLPDSFSSALGAFLTRSQHRIGYAHEWRSPLLTHAYPKPLSVHRVQEYRYLLDAYTGNDGFANPAVRLNASALKLTKTALAGVDAARPVILFNPNSEAQSRRIPLKKAVAIADSLLQEFNGTLVLPGAESDRSFTKAIRALLRQPARCLDLAGTTNCLELAALCHAADLVVSADSGIAHLAAALDRPVAVLFGAGNPASTAPLAPKLAILRAPDIHCAPCVLNQCTDQDPPCIMGIDEDDLIRKCRALLDK